MRAAIHLDSLGQRRFRCARRSRDRRHRSVDSVRNDRWPFLRDRRRLRFEFGLRGARSLHLSVLVHRLRLRLVRDSRLWTLPLGVRLRLLLCPNNTQVVIGAGVVLDGTGPTMAMPVLACMHMSKPSDVQGCPTYHKYRTATCRPTDPCGGRQRCSRDNHSWSNARRHRSCSHAAHQRTPSP